MAGGPEKVDHGGKYLQLPLKLIHSLAWRYANSRERSVLLAIQSRHNGFNNGAIGLTIHEIGAICGNQSHSYNSKAVVGLIERGFVECTSDSNRHQAKSRTYRLTYISCRTGSGKVVPATNEYLEWRPREKTRKFGSEETARRKPVCVAVASTRRKFCGEGSSTPMTESRGFEGHPRGEVSSLHIGNQYGGPSKSDESSVAVGLEILRPWLDEAIARLGYGGARDLAQQAGVPEPTLSRFRAGKNLPSQYRLRLQEACARVVPFSAREAA